MGFNVVDIADMVTAALIRRELRNQLFEVTGPESISFAQCAERIAKHTGRNNYTTNTIEKVLGRKASSFEDYIKKTLKNGV